MLDGLLGEEAQVGCHLVVAGARRVQPSRRVADLLGQARLDVGVDVFQRSVERELAALDLALDFAQPADDGFGVGARDDASPPQHAGVSYRRADVLAVQRGVDVEGAGVGVDEGVSLLREAPAPGLAASSRVRHFYRSFGRCKRSVRYYAIVADDGASAKLPCAETAFGEAPARRWGV